jgi:hypothetical protein
MLKILAISIIFVICLFSGTFLLFNYINEHHPGLFINKICINKVLYYETKGLIPAYNPNGTLKICGGNNEVIL